MRNLSKNCTWRVISDPLDVGGFEPNTKFSADEVVYMLRSRSFTIGTVLLHGKKGRFVIERGVDGSAPLQLVNAQKVLVAYGQKLVSDPIVEII